MSGLAAVAGIVADAVDPVVVWLALGAAGTAADAADAADPAVAWLAPDAVVVPVAGVAVAPDVVGIVADAVDPAVVWLAPDVAELVADAPDFHVAVAPDVAELVADAPDFHVAVAPGAAALVAGVVGYRVADVPDFHAAVAPGAVVLVADVVRCHLADHCADLFRHVPHVAFAPGVVLPVEFYPVLSADRSFHSFPDVARFGCFRVLQLLCLCPNYLCLVVRDELTGHY